ncbi:MAG: AraC family transcriptional regulator [Lachnospiraceae bacterium]|jgi:AraC family transcriptional regulator|nr:AraC family transcriptional regulator [Lachnospiraceae bacterium]
MKDNYIKKINQSLVYIETNLKQKMLIDEVLENTYYSYPQFYRIFMQVVGESMSFYIRKRRLSCAAEELISTQKKIIDIALDYGFSSQQTFNRSFTGYFGISPLKYRERGELTGFYPPFLIQNYIEDGKSLSVAIEELKPMSVATYHQYTDNIRLSSNGEEQERIITKVWNKLIQWQMTYEYQNKFGNVHKLPTTRQLGKFMIDNELHVPPHTRYFGFNNPYSKKKSEFGYEAWIMIENQEDDCVKDRIQGDISIKNFEGGLYATAFATYGEKSNLDEVWRKLHYWLAENQQYQYGEHQWLEEHITKASEGGFHGFKLYLPIQQGQNKLSLD